MLLAVLIAIMAIIVLKSKVVSYPVLPPCMVCPVLRWGCGRVLDVGYVHGVWYVKNSKPELIVGEDQSMGLLETLVCFWAW